MKNSELFSVGARLIGLVLALKLLMTLPYVALAVKEVPSGYGLYSLLIYGAEVMIVAFLIFAPQVIGRFLFKGGTVNEKAETGWSLKDIQRTAFSVLGMFFVVQAITYFSGILASVQFVSNGFQTEIGFRNSLIQLVPQIVQLILGLWLLFGAKGLWRLLRKAGNTD